MKRKAYLKGLGLGILITCVILVIAGRSNRTMSDEEVIKRARELGYVESSTLVSNVNKDSNDKINDKNINNNENKETEVKNEPQEKKKEVSDEKEDKENIVKEDSGDKEKEKKTKPEESDENDIPVEKDEKTETEKQEEENTQIPEKVIVTIKPGDSSETVSARVKEAGLIDDSESFNKYLCSNGYDKIIRVGDHEIPKGSSVEEIAEILSGK